MNFSKNSELVGGVLTAALGPLPPFVKHGAYTVELYRLWPSLLLDDILLSVAPGLLIAIGSFLHTTRGKTGGLLLVLLATIFLVLLSAVLLIGGAIFYWFGLAGGIIVLTQAMVALITLVIALSQPSQLQTNSTSVAVERLAVLNVLRLGVR